MADDESTDLSREELAQLRHVSLEVDELLEQSLRDRESLDQTFSRCFPLFLELTGAQAIGITTRDEELRTRTWSGGEWGSEKVAQLLAQHPEEAVEVDGGAIVTQPLDVAGETVGTLGLRFATGGDLEHRRRLLDTLAEQLDTVLVTVHTAAQKHHLILEVNDALANPVFEVGLDGAVAALAERIRLPSVLLVYRDAVRPQVLRYRTYENGKLAHASDARPHPALEQVLRQRGDASLAREDQALREAFAAKGAATEAVLIAGASRSVPMGKVLVQSGSEGFAAFSLDLIHVLASTLAQRLVDYNRERIHLSQFFSPDVIDALLKAPDYEERYLVPRDEEVGILFADINSFTRLCERGLESPAAIGQFVDRWSAGVVEILFRHGGVFDKMVGDCVIGLFGPPFFNASRLERAEAAVRAARDIQDFTRAFETPDLTSMCRNIQVPGLGVAVGVNLAHTFCGLFGPNRQYTGFSTGMNQTARLQALGAFRETMVMESVRSALQESKDESLRALAYGPLTETPVKNVAHPLRHFRLL